MGMLLLLLQASAVVKVELSLAILGWCSLAILGRRVKLSVCRLMVMVNHIWHLVAVPALPTPVT
jgi:hypothetical protein